MKSEPEAYSINHLKKDRKTTWDGIRNYQVRNMLRDEFSVGDRALFYHSNAGEDTGVVGTMSVITIEVVDSLQFDPKSEYFDRTSSEEDPRWITCRMAYGETFSKVVTLKSIKANPVFKHLPLVQKGNRLSIMPINKKDFELIVRLGKV